MLSHRHLSLAKEAEYYAFFLSRLQPANLDLWNTGFQLTLSQAQIAILSELLKSELL